MTTMLNLTFLNRQCRLAFHRYANGRLALELVTLDGEPVATATVNVPGMPLGADQVLIKDYAENTGLLQTLEDAGVLRPTGVRCKVGHALADVCCLLIRVPTVH